jgi:hypothetical protein
VRCGYCSLAIRDEKTLDVLTAIEYAEMVSGQICGKMFSDMGAEVIKIEAPHRGGPARHHSLFPNEEPHPEERGLFLHLNTGEKGCSMEESAYFTSRGARRNVWAVGCSLVLSEPGAKLVPNQRGESSQRGKNVVVRCARKARWKGHVRKEARLLELDTPFKLDKRPRGF